MAADVGRCVAGSRTRVGGFQGQRCCLACAQGSSIGQPLNFVSSACFLGLCTLLTVALVVHESCLSALRSSRSIVYTSRIIGQQMAAWNCSYACLHEWI